MNKNIKRGIQVAILALTIITVGAFIQNGVHSLFTPKETIPIPPQPPVYKAVTCPNDYSSYQLLTENNSQTVKLIDKRKVMFARSGRFVNTQVVITKNETKESKVACGYLYVRAGTLTYGALQFWEYLYINPNDFGGHIDKENQFGSGDGRNYSEYLFSLNKVKYWKDNRNFSKDSLLIADWGALLNVSDTVSFQIAFNTSDYTGFIDELSIAYKCLNPTTGEENNGCRLSIVSTNDTVTTNPF